MNSDAEHPPYHGPWRGHPVFKRLHSIAVETPSSLPIANYREKAMLLGNLMSFVPVESFAKLAERCFEEFEKHSAHEGAEAILSEIALQAGATLLSQVERIVDMSKTDRFPALLKISSAWDELDWQTSVPLRRVIEEYPYLMHRVPTFTSTYEVSLRSVFLHALIRSKNKQVIEYALAECRRLPWEQSEDPGWALYRNGAVYEEDGIFELYSPQPCHLAFREAQALRSKKFWSANTDLMHPTWRDAPENAPPIPFGGPAEGTCPQCHRALAHLFTLDPIPSSLGITSLSRLRLTTCLHCVSCETSFFEHTPEGDSAILKWGDDWGWAELDEPLMPLEARLTTFDKRWQKQTYGSEQNVNRVGGQPTWVQNGKYPACIRCGSAMIFIAQLDSDFPTAHDEVFLWGSGGMLYIYWCDDCSISAQLWQCT